MSPTHPQVSQQVGGSSRVLLGLCRPGFDSESPGVLLMWPPHFPKEQISHDALAGTWDLSALFLPMQGQLLGYTIMDAPLARVPTLGI